MSDNKTQNYNESDIKTLHTYTSDMADAVRTNETSVIKIALAEKRKKENEEIYKKSEGTPFTKTLLVVTGTILILGSFAGVYFALQKKKQNEAPPQVITESKSIINSEKKINIDGRNITNKKELVASLQDEIKKIDTEKIITEIIIQTENHKGEKIAISKDDFLRRMETTAPGRFTRSLQEQYMIGVYTSVKNQTIEYDKNLFFIFQTKDHDQTFTGLLEWERNMLNDLALFFEIDTLYDNSSLLGQGLKDAVVANIDARVLRNKDNKVLFYYTIVNKDKVIIADDSKTIEEVINRLLIKK